MVIVVGTSHPIQTNDLSLTPFLERLLQEFKVCGIAEEMNEEALYENGWGATIPMRVARALKIPHRFCDPNREERVKLGIRQENDIRIQDWLSQSNLSDSEIQSMVMESHARRERHWLEQLNDFNVWPVLFVCGADHVPSFHQLLQQQGIATHIAAEDWAS
jgi:hypothetical protein